MRMTKIYYYEEHVVVDNGKGQRGNNHQQKKIAANNSNSSNGGHHKKNNQKQNQCGQRKGNANGSSSEVRKPEPRALSNFGWCPMEQPATNCPGSYTVQNGVRTVEAEFVEVHHSGLINCAKRLIGWN